MSRGGAHRKVFLSPLTILAKPQIPLRHGLPTLNVPESLTVLAPTIGFVSVTGLVRLWKFLRLARISKCHSNGMSYPTARSGLL